MSKNDGKYDKTMARTVGIDMTRGQSAYADDLYASGFVEGPLGDWEIPHEVWQAMEALHHVLAGGEVEITVKRKGSPDVVTRLNKELQTGIDEANSIHRVAERYIVFGI